MRSTRTALLMLARLLGAAQLVVGLCIWLGWRSPVRLHTGVGSLFVLVLWVLAVIALFRLSKRFIALFTLLWGGVTLWFGTAQTGFLVGPMHWTIRVLHALIGLAALGLAESLGKALRIHDEVQP